MRYPEGHKASTRERIVATAARLFRVHGFAAVGIDRLMAAAGLTRGGFYEVSGTGYRPEGEITLEGEVASLARHGHLQALIEVVAVANDTHIAEEDGQWRVTGEPTEGALRTLAHKAGFDAGAHERHASIPFESANKFMATLNTAPGGQRRILLKGAPDRLLERCRHELGAEGELEALDRAGGKVGNKGADAALAALEMLDVRDRLS